MGLILPQTIKVKIASKNIEHYKSKGYEIPKRPLLGASNQCRKKRDWAYDLGAYIEVDVLDLMPGCNEKVAVICDKCGEIIYVPYKVYLKNVKEDESYYCLDCTRRSPKKHVDTPEDSRNTPGYRKMVNTVLNRDNYTCQCCGRPAEVVHHKNSFNWCIEGREDPENGVSLCGLCHTSYHVESGYGNNHAGQYEQWVKENRDQMVAMDYTPGYSKPFYCFENHKVYYSWSELQQDFNNMPKHVGYSMLKKGNHLHSSAITLIWYDEYLKMTSEEREYYFAYKNTSKNSKSYICLDTLEVFVSGLLAAKKYHTTSSSITIAIKNKSCAGHDENGKPLHWMLYDDYLKATQEEIAERMSFIPSHYKPVILLNTGELFNKYTDASKETGISNSTISNYCRGKSKTGGILNNGDKASWILLSDYNNLAQFEKNKIYKTYKESFLEGSFLFKEFYKEENNEFKYMAS